VYHVKEIFYTLQGEGANAGTPAVFCRFAGCNLWSGREQDRAGAVCPFCDTDFVGTDGSGGGKFEGFEIAVETNGSIPATPGLDWICVSPKAGVPLAQITGDELKLIYPQQGADPALYEDLAFDHFLLQPMDGPEILRNTVAAVDYCLAHPRWRLSLQTHKMIGVK